MLARVTVLLALGLLCYLEGAAGQDDQDDYPKRMGCAERYNPVCGRDGRTYENRCVMAAVGRKTSRNIRMWHRGPCRDDDAHES